MLLFELRQEVWDSSLVTTGYSGSLSCCLREVKSPFELRGGARNCSGVTAGEIRPQFTWKEGSQSVSQVVAGSVGFLELRRGPVGASHVVSGKSGILSSCEGPLRIPLELVQGTRASS